MDIHGVLQKYNKTNNEWEDIKEYDYGYKLFFSILRGKIISLNIKKYPKQIVPLRGPPSDFLIDEDDRRPLNKEEIEKCKKSYTYYLFCGKWMGGHSFGWVTGEELIAYANTNQTAIVDENQARGYEEASTRIGENEYEININVAHADFFDEIKNLMKEHGTIRYVFGFDQ
jgi:hypothetical protein